MKRKTMLLGWTVAMTLCWNAATAAQPAVNGAAKGLELCPQYICGAAIFAGTFTGTVDQRFAVGSWVVSVNHEDPIPVSAGESKEITGGQWRMTVWVFRGFFPQRLTLGGSIAGGSIVANGNDTFLITMQLAQDATATLTMAGVLDHNTFPPTVAGTVSP